MKTEIYSSFSESLTKLAHINDWLSSAGIRPKADRFRLQLNCLESAANAEQRGNIAGYTRGLKDDDRRMLIWAITETTELYDVWSAFPALESSEMRNKLVLALSGPPLQTQENANNNIGRNTMFELSLAARMLRGGLQVEIGQENPDVVVTVPSGKIFVQCKRPLRSRSVGENVMSASGQLRRDMKADSSAKGVIAISLSKAILERGEFRFLSHEDALPALNDEAQREVQKYETSWCNVRDPNIVGVLFPTLYPVIVLETSSILAVQYVVHGRIPGRRSSAFDELVRRLPQ